MRWRIMAVSLLPLFLEQLTKVEVEIEVEAEVEKDGPT